MQIYPLKLYFSLIKKFIMFSSLNIDIKKSSPVFCTSYNYIKNLVSFLWFGGGGGYTHFVLSHTFGVKFSYCTLVYTFIHQCTFLYISVYLYTFC